MLSPHDFAHGLHQFFSFFFYYGWKIWARMNLLGKRSRFVFAWCNSGRSEKTGFLFMKNILFIRQYVVTCRRMYITFSELSLCCRCVYLFFLFPAPTCSWKIHYEYKFCFIIILVLFKPLWQSTTTSKYLHTKRAACSYERGYNWHDVTREATYGGTKTLIRAEWNRCGSRFQFLISSQWFIQWKPKFIKIQENSTNESQFKKSNSEI